MSVLGCKEYALHYPKIAVQLPMFNERAVCQAIIDAACELQWPAQRLKIQVRLPHYWVRGWQQRIALIV